MKLTSDNYYSLEANQKFMNFTQYKDFITCEKTALASVTENPDKPGEPLYKKEVTLPMLVGSFVDKWMSEGEKGLAEFIERNHDLIMIKDGPKPKTKPQKYKLGAKFKHAKEVIIPSIERDQLFADAISGHHQGIFTADMFGVIWKCAVDAYIPEKGGFHGKLTDLKVYDKLKDKVWVREYEGIPGHWVSHYDDRLTFTQLALYCAIIKISEIANNYPTPYLAVITSEPTPDKAIISFDDKEESYIEFIEKQLRRVAVNMPRILLVKSGKEEPRECGVCEYCKKTKLLTHTTHYRLFDV